MSRRRVALLAGLALLAPSVPARAQTALSVAWGENADAVTGVGGATTLSMGLSHMFGTGGLTLGGGAPLDDAGLRWASATGWLDLPIPALRSGLLAGAQGFGYEDDVLDASGRALAADLQAYRELDAGPARVRLRAGGRAGALAAGRTTLRRALARAGVDATVLTGPLIVRASTDLWSAAEGLYPEVSLTGYATHEAVTVHARLSRWLHQDVPGTGWGLTAELALVRGLGLVASASQPATDILFFSPAQRSWSIGMRYATRTPPARALPAPVIVDAGQRVRLRVDAVDGASPVRLAGTFNGWSPEPMTLVAGRWVADLRLQPGVYEYAFVAPDGSWFVPEGTPGRKADGFGGFIATIVVR
ncbi:MAG: glycogen-binding domain-containing protein [Gemmatimonadetes bacterium]|nr:glycogen-binding domain-containing protein [Gemmatimonadota bacterium]